MPNFAIIILSSVVSLLAVKYTILLAKNYGIGSLPSPRKIHTEFKPLLGGIGFSAGIGTALIIGLVFGVLEKSIFTNHKYFWMGLLVIIVIGLIDDFKGVKSKIKFSGQGIAAVLLIFDGCRIASFSGPMGEVFDLGIFALPFTFLWIIFIINAINLMDGLDGLAGGVSLIILVGFLVLSLSPGNEFMVMLAIGLAGGILGFLRYNYHPASIFMGDVGSLQLGYILAFFSIESLKVAGSHQVNFLAALVMLGVPLTDTLNSFLRRLGQGKSPFLADKQHFHHRLYKLGLSHLQTVWMLYMFTALYVILGVLIVYFQGIIGLSMFLIAFIFSIYWIWRLGYFETRFSMQNFAYQFARSIFVQRRAPLHVNRIWHKLILFFSDILFVNAALFFTYWMKFESGLFQPAIQKLITDYFSTPVFLLLTVCWILLFWMNNLYHMEWDVSRFDKILRVAKVATFGILAVGITTADFQQVMSRTQMFSLTFYWFFIIVFVNAGRLLIIEIEKRLKIFEYSPKKTLIIGCNELARKALQDIRINPHLIFDVAGFVSKKVTREEFQGLPVLGDYTLLPSLIHQYKIEEVIIALPEGATDDFIQILSLCEAQQVKIKIPPGSHEIFAGQQVGLISHAYLQIFPENMVLWQWMLKRIHDIVVSFIALVVLSPLFIILSAIIYLRFKNPVIIKIPILGKNAIPFNMYAFRMTLENYDYQRNPVYLGSGFNSEISGKLVKILSKTRLYKLPQLVNVFLGDMGFVGPRPEPPEWYENYRETVRFLHRRLSVRPGLTGLAQVKYHYELSQKILQERVKFDIFYIENLSIRLDIRILLRTLLIVFRKPELSRQQEKSAEESLKEKSTSDMP